MHPSEAESRAKRMARRSRRTPTPFHAQRVDGPRQWDGHFAATARSRTRKRNAPGDRSFVDRYSARALPCSERNLILARGWLNQFRNPPNRGGIGRFEIELLDQECDAV